MIHASMTGALSQVDRAVESAKDSGRFMAAVWYIGENGELICKRTTWQFPLDRMSDAVEQLAKMIDDERAPRTRRLPVASFLSGRGTIPHAPVEQPESFDQIDGEDGE